jgi:hypothetical protein
MCAKRFNPDTVPKSSSRPLRDFILQLPLLSINAKSEIYYEQADPALLVQLADNGDIAMRTIHLGLSAIGLLLANSAPEFETHEISGDATEALGWLLAEWGEFAAVAHCISAGCRRQITDYRPGTIKVIPNVRP